MFPSSKHLDKEKRLRDSFNENQKYINDSLNIYLKLNYVIEQLNHVEIFMSRYPNRKYYEENGINKLTYYQYHLEAFAHKIHTILELMKLLLNQIYSLDIKPRDCNWLNLSSKINPNTLSMKIIDWYYQTFKDLINLRHSNTHRGIFNDRLKTEIEVEYGLTFHELKQYFSKDELNLVFPKSMINNKIKKYKTDRIEYLKLAQQHVHLIVKTFFESLTNTFIRIDKALDNNV